MASPTRVAVTGAAGQIGYSLLFRIASGDLLGPDQPVQLQLLEIPPALDALEGVAMELDDCAFPLLAGIVQTDEPETAFEGADVALLVGSRPRTEGHGAGRPARGQRRHLHRPGQGPVGRGGRRLQGARGRQPGQHQLPDRHEQRDRLPDEHFTAMTRLDHNRAMAQLAAKAGVPVTDVTTMTIWGNHSATQYPDLFHAEVGGKPAAEVIDDQAWIENDFIPTVQQRGAAIIEARGSSSAASAANAAIDHVRTWVDGTPEGDWVSMAIPSDGSYGVPEGLISSFPCTTEDGEWSIVQGLDIDDFSRQRIDASVGELAEERDTVQPRPDLTRLAPDCVTWRR